MLNNILEHTVYDDYIHIIIMSEKFDLYDTPKIGREIDEIFSVHGYQNTIFDICNIKYIDSSGIGLIIGTKTKIDSNRKKISLLCNKSNDKLLHIFTKARLHEVFAIFTNNDDAIKYVTG